jgi:hypothetical protein
MTDLAVPLTVDGNRSRPARTLSILAAGLFGGFALGIIARAWMRLISDDPEFSWTGTIFILAGFTIFGFTQSIAAVGRRRAKRRWALSLARSIGVVGLLPLFVGAGAIMLPTVVGGGLALARVDWRRLVRAICLLAAMFPVVLVGTQLVGSFGWSAHTLIGFLAMVAIYGAIVVTTRFTIAPRPDGLTLDRRVRIVILVVLCLVLTYSLVGVVG